MVKKVLTVVAVIVAALTIVFVRTYLYQQGEFKKGEAAMATGNLKDAVVFYETAIHMYTPGSSAIKSSIDRLFEIARIYESRNEPRWALDAYENLRSALYATKSFYQPYPEVIAVCDVKIKPLAAKAR